MASTESRNPDRSGGEPGARQSAYSRIDIQRPMGLDVELAGDLDVNQIADDVVARIHSDPDFAAQVARQLRGTAES